MANARDAVVMHKCLGDPRHWCAPTTPAGRVVDALTSPCVVFYGHIRLWPPQYPHEWPVHAAQLGCKYVGWTPTLVCAHHARSSRSGRSDYPVCGLLWPHTSMATPVRAQLARGHGAVGMHKYWADPRHRFSPTTPAGRVVEARAAQCVDFYGRIRLWPPQYAHEWPVHAARLGCTSVGGTPTLVCSHHARWSLSHYASQPAPLGWSGDRWYTG